MVLKRIRLWISAIIFMLRASMTIRQIRDCDEFLLFLRERVYSMDPIRTNIQWGYGISRIASKAVWDENLRPRLEIHGEVRSKTNGSVKTGTINGSKNRFRFRTTDPMPLNECHDRQIRSIYKCWNIFWLRAKTKAKYMESICRIYWETAMECRFSSIKSRPSLLRCWLD
jgi:hypothetical protein